MRAPVRFALLLASFITTVTSGCGVAVRRDLSAIPPGQVGFDDLCGLQGYFDALAAGRATAPALVSGVDLESGAAGRPARGGRARFAFEGEFQLRQLRRVLDENWRRLPRELASADHVEIQASWSERAGVRRVVTNRDAELIIGPRSWALPYQACLSELLYGEPLYRQRRELP
jgi:hypothetical protein